MGIDRYECVFTDNAKIAEQLEITAIRCNKRTPEISLWSLSSGGCRESRTRLKIFIFQVFDSSADSFPDSAVCPNGA
jgi:hypothetical protein